MALQLHRLFAIRNSPSSYQLSSMYQFRAMQHYTDYCVPSLSFRTVNKSEKCVQLKFRNTKDLCLNTAPRSRVLRLNCDRDFLDGVGRGMAIRIGFPHIVKRRNAIFNRSLECDIRLQMPYYDSAGKRSFSVKTIQNSEVQRSMINGSDKFSFKLFDVHCKRAKSSSAACSSRSYETAEVALPSNPVKGASRTRRSASKTVDSGKPKEKVGGEVKKDVAVGPSLSTLSENVNCNQQSKAKGKRKPLSRSKKQQVQACSTAAPPGEARPKRASMVERTSVAESGQNSESSERTNVAASGQNLLSSETLSDKNTWKEVVLKDSDKTTGKRNSSRKEKPQKEGVVAKNSDKTSLKSEKSNLQVSSMVEPPSVPKLNLEAKTKPPRGRALPQLYPPTGKSVVIVESLTKAKVIQGYLGDMYEVLPSYGHVRDLAAKSGSVRPDEDFSMVWEVPSAAWTHLKTIKVALSGAENLILASDPDREGEAIAWHIIEMLQQQDALRETITVARAVFHEITESSIKSALQAPRDIDVNLVHAYLARRALDYLIGFSISPLLWRKLPGCPSAGRVQSAALSLICDRETEIDEFKAQEHWTIEVEFNKNDLGSSNEVFSLLSHLTHVDSKRLEQLSIGSHDEARLIEQKINSSHFEVLGSKRSKIRKNPPAPYITSTLQQDAARKLHFPAMYTMKLAQKLYEGVKLSDAEATGLITYMRTDGLHVSEEAAKDIRSLVKERYGKDFTSGGTRKYFKKVKNAQEAHEAIRPTSIRRLPSMLDGILDEDSLRLYTLIWSQTMACQMEPTVIDMIQLDIGSAQKSLVFRSTCSNVEFLGFQAVYKDTEAAAIGYEGENSREEMFKALSTLKSGDPLHLAQVELKQHSTQPPSRYSEGSLVKKLEDLGIGRPSTYASTIKVLQDRNYVIVRSRVLHPEFRGRMVSAFLSHHFSEVTDYGFTAGMENELDNVSAGLADWKGLLKDYWTRFSMYCDRAAVVNIREVEKMLEETFGDFLFSSLPDKNRTCPSCKTGSLVFKVSRFGAGYFIGCDQHPKCKYIAKTIYGNDDDEDSPQKLDSILEPKLLGLNPSSSEKVYLKKGPYGFYVQLGDDRAGYLPKRASVSQIKDVESITLEDALDLLRYPIILGNHPQDGQPILLKLAKFGFSVRHRRTIAPVPKNVKPNSITIEKAVKFLSSKGAKQCGRPKNKPKTAEDIEAM